MIIDYFLLKLERGKKAKSRGQEKGPERGHYRLAEIILYCMILP